MVHSTDEFTPSTAWVGHIPLLWVKPAQPAKRLAIWLNGLTGKKEDMLPYLQALAEAGFAAVSFDLWQHGERGHETREEMANRVFGNFYHDMWPMLGHTTLDTLRVIDWAIPELGVGAPEVCMGGISMGGDISVAAAGLDRRIKRVAAMVATPDWLRPGMHDLFQPDRLLDPGTPDAYARFFYDQINPLTHLQAYMHAPAISFECAADDTHVPPDGALRFQAALQQVAPRAAEQVRVNLIAGANHMDGNWPVFWENCLSWFTQA